MRMVPQLVWWGRAESCCLECTSLPSVVRVVDLLVQVGTSWVCSRLLYLFPDVVGVWLVGLSVAAPAVCLVEHEDVVV